MRRLLLLVTLPFLVDVCVAYALAQPALPVVRVAGLAIPVPSQGGRTQRVFFDWDQPGLSEHARATLAGAVAAAAPGTELSLRIETSDSEVGGQAYIAALWRARLANVMAALVQDGVAAIRIVPESDGLVRVLARGAAAMTGPGPAAS